MGELLVDAVRLVGQMVDAQARDGRAEEAKAEFESFLNRPLTVTGLGILAAPLAAQGAKTVRDLATLKRSQILAAGLGSRQALAIERIVFHAGLSRSKA